MDELTDRQREILDFIRAFHRRNDRTPTGPEIQEHFGYATHATAYHYLRLLEKKGYLEVIQTGDRATLKVRFQRATDAVAERHWPLFGSVTAGPLVEAATDDASVVSTLDDLLPLREGDFLLTVDGDSMTGAGLADGMIVAIRPTTDVADGTICAVYVDGEGNTLKRVYRDGTALRLVPENPIYPEMTYPAEQVRIQGKLVASLAVQHFR